MQTYSFILEGSFGKETESSKFCNRFIEIYPKEEKQGLETLFYYNIKCLKPPVYSFISTNGAYLYFEFGPFKKQEAKVLLKNKLVVVYSLSRKNNAVLILLRSKRLKNKIFDNIVE